MELSDAVDAALEALSDAANRLEAGNYQWEELRNHDLATVEEARRFLTLESGEN